MPRQLSLFIPRVFANISEQRIERIFYSLGYGQVDRVDFVEKKGINGTGPYKSAYIHFDYWFDNDVADRFQERVRNPNKEARVVYDDPWFWIVLENKLMKEEDYPEYKEEKEEGEESETETEDLQDEDEDEEMDQILTEMEETEQLMGEESYDLVAADYVTQTEFTKRWYYENLVKEITRRDLLEDNRLDQEEHIAYLENEVMDLKTQLAHFKQLLAYYEPDERFQNPELVEY